VVIVRQGLCSIWACRRPQPARVFTLVGMPRSKQPDFLQNLRHEMGEGRQWLDRIVVIGFAVLAGLAVVVFTWLYDAAFAHFQGLRTRLWWAPLVWTPAVTALVVWSIRQWARGAFGSGVPQVMAALDPHVPPHERQRFVSLKLSVAKILGVTGGVLGGLSIGRQGPAVQVAAGIMHHARRYLSPRTSISDRELLVAGGAAGIAAAFNTPLGGIVFAIEELSRRLEQRSSGLMLAAIVVSGLVAVSVFGNLSYFGRVSIGVVSWTELLWPGFLIALTCGLMGGLLARLLLVSFTGLPDRFCAYRRAYPVRFAAWCGFGVAVIGIVTDGAALGGGHHHVRELLSLQSVEEHTPLLFSGLKLVASWWSAWSGVPGGVFGPSLAIGAGVGADVAWLTQSTQLQALIAIGMAGFLAAVTQTPITAMIIVMEMTDGHGMVLSLMASALLASLVSRMISRPLYGTMTEYMLEGAIRSDRPVGAPSAEPPPPSAPASATPPAATPAPDPRKP
jgi:H+/Cl- antiporter ClcA